MFRSIGSFLRRHKRKFLIFGGVVGGVVVLNTYFRRKFLEWEKKRTMEYLELLKRQNHFDGTLQTCDSALLSFMGKVREIICKTIDVDPIVEKLKSKPPNKLELWEELKVLVFTQAIGEVYAQCLLVVLLRVQLSILGGYIYADFQKSRNASGENTFGSSDAKQRYLTHFSNFIVGGIKDLLIPIEDAVRQALRGIKLDTKMKLSEYSELFRQINNTISQDSAGVVPNIAQYMMMNEQKDSNQNENGDYNDFLDKICSETKDVLECEDFSRVLMSSLEHGIALLMDRTSECFMHISGNGGEEFLNPHNVAVPLAKIIPTMHVVFANHKPDERGSLIHTLLQQESLRTFSANLYEAFSQDSS